MDRRVPPPADEHEHLEGRRRGLQQRHLLSLNHLDDRNRVALRGGGGEAEARARGQWQEEFEHRDVEAEGRQPQHGVARAERPAEALLVEMVEQADDPAVLDHHPFRLARRPTGVKHVRQTSAVLRRAGVPATVPQLRLLVRNHHPLHRPHGPLRPHFPAQLAHRPHLHERHRQATLRPRTRRHAPRDEEHREARFGQDVGLPVGGKTGVDGHVGAAGLEDGDEAHGRPDAAREAHAHQPLLPHAEAPEGPCEGRGPVLCVCVCMGVGWSGRSIRVDALD